MQHFRHLLYVSHGTTDENEGLKQALSLARNNHAPLKVLIVCPDFPAEFPDYQQNYQESLLTITQARIQRTQDALKLAEGAVDVSIDFVSDKTPAINIIQYVLQHQHDLVIKEAESQDNRCGLKTIDMNLLRKCPVPVWLCRPIEHSHQQIQVAVAIDPKSQEQAAESLSRRMLALSRSLADSCSGELHIISCWDYEFEAYLRGNMWIKTSDDEIDQTVLRIHDEHRAALEALIRDSGISGQHLIHHLRGKPTEMIPDFVVQKPIDILVMGTVARTGIPGFMIGNTAENIVQKLNCSLIGLKPQGFISPVKAG
ncbi:Universal stress protein E [Vibrio aerogenes CECT 7868]|uniref:Universal stress protein E n=1 Tax=Vibrio aerogenes CECT 7868 TaxID=1216006 RepID=A0A1M6DE99_9VIBR|nr:universal stress protein [Vibrio aerogenes]SHI71532.1 Universal stress protein E [Vibrio aerogenes CECT 7868]